MEIIEHQGDGWIVKIVDTATKEEIPANIIDNDTGNYDVH